MKNLSFIGSSKFRMTTSELDKIRGGSGGCGCCLCSPGQAGAGDVTARNSGSANIMSQAIILLPFDVTARNSGSANILIS